MSAELPDEHENPVLYSIVRRVNMHSRDHLVRPNSRCNKNGRCEYGFPQPLSNQTTVDAQGRVHLCRRKEEDRWVVPYMPCLLQYMNCHIHVDVCSSVTVFMYLYKYLFKGSDQTQFNFQAASEGSASALIEDEFDDYISSHYLSFSEAVYQIFSFHITSKNPPVKCLSVHLENEQLGQMHQSGDNQSFMSDLLWYFCRPHGPNFDGLKYTDFYNQYYF
jgi:hypothetical protein